MNGYVRCLSMLTAASYSPFGQYKVGRSAIPLLTLHSWDLGVCPPSWLLETEGFLATKAPNLRSLSLITDPSCRSFGDGEGSEGCTRGYAGDLPNLRKLSWRGFYPGGEYNMIRQWLADHVDDLEELTLDFVNWGAHLLNEDTETDDFFPDHLMRRQASDERTILKTLQVLSVYEASFGRFTDYLAEALNMRRLTSLKLVNCFGVEPLLEVLSSAYNSSLRHLELVHDLRGWDAILPHFTRNLDAYLESAPSPIKMVQDTLSSHQSNQYAVRKPLAIVQKDTP